MKYIHLIAVIILLAGCNGKDGSNNESLLTQESLLHSNIALWESKGISSYQYTYSKACECLPEEDVVVSVVNNSVLEGVYTPSGTYLTDDKLNKVPTVSSLFADIQQAFDMGYFKVEVDYDPELGYPTRVFIDQDEQFFDDEITHLISDFQ